MASADTARAPRPRTRWSRLVLGDWTSLVRDPIDLIRLSFLVGAFAVAVAGDHAGAARLALTFAATLVARHLDLPRPFDLAFNLAMGFQAWGNGLGLFEDVYAYDKLVHFVLPMAMSSLLYVVALRLQVLPDLEHESGIRQRAGILLVTFSMGVTLGAGYEVYEYVMDHAFGANLEIGYGDTIGDLVDDAAGALAGGLLIVIWDTYGWGTRRRVSGRRLEGDRTKGRRADR
jgi:hypothetical protein